MLLVFGLKEGELNEKPWPAQINSDAIDQGTGRCTGEILGTLKHQTEGNIEEGEEEVRCETQPIAAMYVFILLLNVWCHVVCCSRVS